MSGRRQSPSSLRFVSVSMLLVIQFSGFFCRAGNLLSVRDLETAVDCAIRKNMKSSTSLSSQPVLSANDFTDYGCYCGSGVTNVAKSGIPVDVLDLCCRRHNECWNRVDEDMGNNHASVLTPKLCFVTPTFLKCDEETYEATCDRNHNFFSVLRGSVGDRCCDCDAQLSKCIADALDLHGTSIFNVKYLDWSDPGLMPVFQFNRSPIPAENECGPRTPSFSRQMKNIAIGMDVAIKEMQILFNKTSDSNTISNTLNVINNVRVDYLQTAENKTIVAMQEIAEDGVDKILHEVNEIQEESRFALFDIARAAADEEDKVIFPTIFSFLKRL